jgi:EPS-associated MarR family transcriptional regulator
MKNQEEDLKILREIHKKPEISQRELSKSVDFSLGKLNYCIKALKLKGILKIKNFNKSKNKLKYIYILTPKGILYKTNITMNFFKIKMKEYEELKKELNK